MKKLTIIHLIVFCFASNFVFAKDPVIADPKIDTGFKQLMSIQNDSDKTVAMSFINAFVPDFEKNPVTKIDDVAVAIPPILEKVEKQVFMDFHCTTSNKDHVIIEMQMRRHTNFDERALFYAAYTFSHQLTNEELKKKEWYNNLKRVYAIQILNYDSNRATPLQSNDIKDSLPGRVKGHEMKKEDFMKHYKMTDGDSGQTLDSIQILQIELPRVKNQFQFPPRNGENISEQQWWLMLFRQPEIFSTEFIEEMKRQKTSVPQSILLGLEKLNFAKWRPNIRDAYNSEMKDLTIYDLGMATERAEGRAEGRVEGTLNVAIDLFIANGGRGIHDVVLQNLQEGVKLEMISLVWGERDKTYYNDFNVFLNKKGVITGTKE